MNLNRRVCCRPGFGHRGQHFYFHELLGSSFAQPFLPSEKLRSTQPPLPAKRRHALSALRLLQNQLLPLRPCLFASLLLPHDASLLSSDHHWQDGVQISLTKYPSTLKHTLAFTVTSEEEISNGDPCCICFRPA